MFYKELFNKDSYIPEYIHKKVYAVSKSNFLIPLKLWVYFVQTEGNEFIYIAEITKIEDYEKDLENNEENYLKCIVMTDDNFYIQSFTPNCINELKLNDSFINSNINIINFIKQLKEEYLRKINQLYKVVSLNATSKNMSHHHEDSSDKQNNIGSNIMNNITYIEKKKIKKELIESKYLGILNSITWKINLNHNTTSIDGSIFKNSISNINKSYNIADLKHFYEEDFMLQIKKIVINKELLGYYFIFQNELKEFVKNHHFVSNIFEVTDNRNNVIAKRKKYHYLFEINPILISGTKSIISEGIKKKKKVIKFKSYEKEEFNQCLNKVNEINSNMNTRNRSSKVISSTDLYNDINKNHIIINEDYIPENIFKFEFDLANRCYKPIYDLKNDNEKNTLNGILHFQALNKVRNYRDYLKSSKDNFKFSKKVFNTYSSQDSEVEDNESQSDSNTSISQKFYNSHSINSFNSKERDNNSYNTKNNSSLDNKNYDINNNSSNSENNSDEQNKKQSFNKNDLFNNIYRVNLNKIFFSIYDFNRDMIVDVDFDKTSKIEKIVMNTNHRLSIAKNIEDFNNIFESYKEDKKRPSSSKNIIDKIKKEIVTDHKIIESKITEAINKEQDEDYIIILYIFSFISMIILLIGSGIFFYFEIYNYSISNTFLTVIKDIISIKYCDVFGVYFARELTLLNVPDTNITGGQYHNIPASNRTEYKSIIREKFLELFIESQEAMVDFIGTTFSISKDSNLLLSQELITKLSEYNIKSTIIKNNIIITIVQLNSAFYNLASSTSPVEENNADLYTFIYNSLNNFATALDILIETYKKELELITMSIIKKVELIIFIYFIIHVIIYIICIFLYSNAIKRKKKYMTVFFNINYGFIADSISKCEEFMNRFKLPEEKK